MKLYSRGLLVASLLTGSSAWAHNVIFDAGYHGNFDKTVIAENDITPSTMPPAPTHVLSGYTFAGWGDVPASLTTDITVKAKYSRTISVEAGTKELLSLNLDLADDQKALLQANLVIDPTSYIKSDKGLFAREVAGTPVNNISDISVDKGYLVYNGSASNASVTVTGTSFNPALTITLSEDYTFVPFLLDAEMNYEHYFADIIDSIDSVKDNAGTVLTAGYKLQPGQSYLVKAKAATSFTPPLATAMNYPGEALADGATLIVTSPYDFDSVDGSPSWSDAIQNGLTLREAVYFAASLPGNSQEKIIFAPHISTIKLADEIALAINSVGFTIDGTDSNRENVTITRVNTAVRHRFLKSIAGTAGTITLNGLIIDNFQTPEIAGEEPGGAIRAIKTHFVISNSTFQNTTSQYSGGAISLANSDLTSTWTKFIGCETTGSAAAVLATSGGLFTMSNSYISNCRAHNEGKLFDIVNDPNATISTSTFMNCGGTDNKPEIAFQARSQWVGYDAKLTVSDSTFINNNFSSFGIKVVDVKAGKESDTATIIFDNISAFGNKNASTTADVEIADEFIQDLDGNTIRVDKTNTKTDEKTIQGIIFIDTGSEVGAYAKAAESNIAPAVNPDGIKSFISSSNITESEFFDVTNLFADANGDDLYFTATGLSDGITFENGIFEVPVGLTKYTYELAVTAEDWTGASATETVTIDVQDPIIVDAATSFAAAITQANNQAGTQIIEFDEGLAEFNISKIVTITDDLIIKGNGAQNTKLQINYDTAPYATIGIKNDTLDPINVSISDLTISGNMGNDITEDDLTGMTSLIVVTGQKVDEDNAMMANLSLDSVEFVDHTANADQGTILATLGNIKIRNSYLNNITSKKAPLLKGIYSSYDIEGVTVDNCATTLADWTYVVYIDNKHTTLAMSTQYNSQLNSSMTNSTFNSNTIGDAAATNNYLVGMTTAAGSTESFTISNLTITDTVVGKISYKKEGDTVQKLTTGGIESDTPLSGPSTRNGVRYYEDDTVEGGIFATTGADELTGY